MQRFSDETYAEDVAGCRALLKTGSRTFHAASFLLPRRVREPASALYAFCRLADDSVDVECADASIEELMDRLDRVYRGTPAPHPADRALMRVVEAFAIPKHLPEALIEGLAWDRAGHRYESIAALHSYAARVAGTVGVMMALLMGVRAPRVLARAADLGIAMQLTNIARDVGEDARAGRLYLPRDWLSEAGIDSDAWLLAPRFTPALGGVVERLLEVADHLYARADIGIASLPRNCRPGILAARLLYAEIGQELRRCGLNSVERRTVVPAGRKARLLAGVLGQVGCDASLEAAPCLEQARFLIEGFTDLPARTGFGSPLRWWNFQAQAIWVLDLFERLERRRSADEPGSAERVTA
jgi:15-cis-phytoene synthase